MDLKLNELLNLLCVLVCCLDLSVATVVSKFIHEIIRLLQSHPDELFATAFLYSNMRQRKAIGDYSLVKEKDSLEEEKDCLEEEKHSLEEEKNSLEDSSSSFDEFCLNFLPLNSPLPLFPASILERSIKLCHSMSIQNKVAPVCEEKDEIMKQESPVDGESMKLMEQMRRLEVLEKKKQDEKWKNVVFDTNCWLDFLDDITIMVEKREFPVIIPVVGICFL